MLLTRPSFLSVCCPFWLRSSLSALLLLGLVSPSIFGQDTLSLGRDSFQLAAEQLAAEQVATERQESLSGQDSSTTSTFRAHRGSLDLRWWRPEVTPQLPIRGQWAFYWNQLLSPAELEANAPTPTGYVDVPADWSTYRIKGSELPVVGAATYVLDIRLPSAEIPLAITIPFVASSYRVWVNGHLEAESGVPQLDPSRSVQVFLKSFVPLPEDTRRVTIVIQVSNNDSPIAGLIETPAIGTRASLLANRDFLNALNMALIGALLALMIYHLFFYFFRRKERAMAAFAAICGLVVIRFGVFGDHHLFEWIFRHAQLFDFTVQSRIYYTSTFLLGPLAVVYLRALYGDDVRRWVQRSGLIAGGVVILLALVLPIQLFLGSLPVIMGALVIIAVYAVGVIIRAAWLGRPQGRLVLFGLGGMALSGVHDALGVAGIYLLTETELFTYGFLFFIFVQFVVVARRFSTTFAAVEDLTENLERKVQQRTAELAAANHEITQKNQDITDSIEYAKRIQLSILPDLTHLREHLPQSFMYYRPKDIVSGDFYWTHIADDGTLTVAIADATGHGVPGAFMSVLGVNLLTRAMHELGKKPEPAAILTALHQWVRQALRQDQAMRRPDQSEDGMEMALVQLCPGNELRYAGANRPLLRLRAGQLDEFAPVKHPIGGSLAAGSMPTVFTTERLFAEPGDVFYLFTDGATDQFGGPGETRRRFSSKRFRTLLTENALLPLTQQHERLADALSQWQGDTAQTDDILIFGFRMAG